MPYKLGRLPKKHNAKTLDFAKYLRASAPPPPPAKLWREYKIPAGAWGMFGNDTIGDCTCAAVAHMIMLTTAHTGTLVTPVEADIIAAYSAITGYDPNQTQPDGSNPTDNGAAITDVLNYWQTTGIAGHKILGWAAIDQTNLTAIKQAIYLFGGIDLGVNLPQSAMDQTQANLAWTPVSGSPIIGGHSIPSFGFGSVGGNVITWAERQEYTWEWFTQFCDEAYAVITEDWIDQSSGIAPNTLNLAALQEDLNALKA
jgi:hypothetical protein